MKSYTPLIVIALCIGIYYFYISPAFADLSQLSAKKTQYTDALEKAKELKSRRDTLLVSYNAIPADDIDRLKKIIPDTIDTTVLARNINAIAVQYGMVIRNVKIDNAQSATQQGVVTAASTAPYQTTNVSFSVKGDYDQFIKFLKDIESNNSLADVDSLSLKTTTASASGTVFDYTIGLHVYSLR